MHTWFSVLAFYVICQTTDTWENNGEHRDVMQKGSKIHKRVHEEKNNACSIHIGI